MRIIPDIDDRVDKLMVVAERCDDQRFVVYFNGKRISSATESSINFERALGKRTNAVIGVYNGLVTRPQLKEDIEHAARIYSA